MDSMDLMPLLRNEAGAKGHEHLLHVKFKNPRSHNEIALRQGAWKLHATYERIEPMTDSKNATLAGVVATHLFNLDTNPTEHIALDYIDSAEPEHAERKQLMIKLMGDSFKGPTV